MYKGLYYIYVVSKNTFDQKKKVFFQMFNHTIFLVFSLYLYKYVYELLPHLTSRLPYPNAIWSMALYFVAFWLGLREIERNIKNDIQTGNIEMYLLRPMGYIWQKVCAQLGKGIIPALYALILSATVCYFIVGLPIIDINIWLLVLGALFILILSQVLLSLIFILCGLSAFWLQDSEPVYFVVSKLMMIFGGAWVPMAFFPQTLQYIAEYSPFGASLAITRAMYPDFREHFFIMILNILFWILVCGIFTWVVLGRAHKRLAVNG